MRTTLTIAAVATLLFSAMHAVAGVIIVTPRPQSLLESPLTELKVVFDTPVNPTTFDNTTFRAFGRWSGPKSGAVIVAPDNLSVRLVPSEPFFFGEWVTVSISKGAEDALGNPIPYQWNFWTRSAPGTLDLTLLGQPISTREAIDPTTRIRTYGAYAGDLNNDGWSDLIMPNEESTDVRVFLNNGFGGYGAFTIHPVTGGSFPSTNEGGDYNNDGHMDFALGNGGSNQMSVFMGDGSTLMAPTSYSAGNSVRGLAWSDIDGDGDDDIVTANRFSDNMSVFTNSGGSFTLTGPLEGSIADETAIAFADANNDGILDAFIAGHTGAAAILLCDGNGNLTFSASQPTGGQPWMLAVGDVNGDGNCDMVVCNSFTATAAVCLGDGTGQFLGPATTYATGAFPLAIDLGDIDGDADLDMVTSNFNGNNWTVYENDGTGVFVNPRSFPSSTTGSCATLHDRDNDGDLDMTGIDEIDDLIFLWDNAPSPSAIDTPPVHSAALGAHPNPFNPSTTIRYAVEIDGATTLEVFNTRGERVGTLVNEFKVAGDYSFVWNARGLPSGVYYARLTTAVATHATKMVLLK